MRCALAVDVRSLCTITQPDFPLNWKRSFIWHRILIAGVVTFSPSETDTNHDSHQPESIACSTRATRVQCSALWPICLSAASAPQHCLIATVGTPHHFRWLDNVSACKALIWQWQGIKPEDNVLIISVNEIKLQSVCSAELRFRLSDVAKAHLSHEAGAYRAHLDKDTA